MSAEEGPPKKRRRIPPQLRTAIEDGDVERFRSLRHMLPTKRIQSIRLLLVRCANFPGGASCIILDDILKDTEKDQLDYILDTDTSKMVDIAISNSLVPSSPIYRTLMRLARGHDVFISAFIKQTLRLVLRLDEDSINHCKHLIELAAGQPDMAGNILKAFIDAIQLAPVAKRLDFGADSGDEISAASASDIEPMSAQESRGVDKMMAEFISAVSDILPRETKAYILCQASALCLIDSVYELVRSGAYTPEHVDEDPMHAVMRSREADGRRKAIVRTLVEAGFDINSMNVRKQNNLLQCMLHSQSGPDVYHFVQFMFSLGAKMQPDVDNMTCLHAAAAMRIVSVPLVQMLIERGADVKARAFGGNTALHFIADKSEIYADDLKVVDILLEAGASIHAKSYMGRELPNGEDLPNTPLSDAQTPAMFAYLYERGAGGIFDLKDFRRLALDMVQSNVVIKGREDLLSGEDDCAFPARCLPCKHVFESTMLQGFFKSNIPGYTTLQHVCPQCRADVIYVEIMSKQDAENWDEQEQLAKDIHAKMSNDLENFDNRPEYKQLVREFEQLQQRMEEERQTRRGIITRAEQAEKEARALRLAERKTLRF